MSALSSTPQSLPRSLILVTGPTRSGKSEWAEKLAAESGRRVIYVATAQVDMNDLEWQNRIAQHQQRRPQTWQTIAVPIDLAATIQSATVEDCLLVDSLGTWLTNLLDQDAATWEQTVQELVSSLIAAHGQIILVAEETGWGVVPAYPLGRLFRDRLGSLTRRIGAIANPVYLVAAGHVLNLSEFGVPLDHP
ncbi:MAG: bifunctional adenosylcobinamide kinase/adenosylcobinamide-phosphate guanylyltransferase [Elainellaceae cyanobacterium]